MTLVKVRSRGINLADDFAFTGTISGAGGGKVGQVVQTSTSTSLSSSSDSYVDLSGFTFNFTPSATNSNVLINCSISTGMDSHSSYETCSVLKLVRDSTDLKEITLVSNYGNWMAGNYSFIFYDTAISTTSQVTYKFQAKRINGGQTFKYNGGYSGAQSYQTSEMTAIEILA